MKKDDVFVVGKDIETLDVQVGDIVLVDSFLANTEQYYIFCRVAERGYGKVNFIGFAPHELEKIGVL